jgi:hypothetical protein
MQGGGSRNAIQQRPLQVCLSCRWDADYCLNRRQEYGEENGRCIVPRKEMLHNRVRQGRFGGKV